VTILAIYAVGLVQLKLAVGRIWKQWKIVSNVYPFLPKLPIHSQFWHKPTDVTRVIASLRHCFRVVTPQLPI
jgi:hypothetical protein